MQQIYRRTPRLKCDFNKVVLQLYWNRTSAWVFSCKYAAYFQNTFSLENIWRVTSGFYQKSSFIQRHVTWNPRQKLKLLTGLLELLNYVYSNLNCKSRVIQKNFSLSLEVSGTLYHYLFCFLITKQKIDWLDWLSCSYFQISWTIKTLIVSVLILQPVSFLPRHMELHHKHHRQYLNK